MKRRQALKNLGFSIGTITMTSTVVSLIQSCSKGSSWNPEFFSMDEAELITKTLNVILPPTSGIPGATELNLTKFIDGYIKHVLGDKEQLNIKSQAAKYLSSTLVTLSKNSVSSISDKEIDSRLSFYFKSDENQREIWQKENSTDASNFKFLITIRNRGISAFKINEYIGENVLAYSPIPGQQIGCVDLIEATGGKAWSL